MSDVWAAIIGAVVGSVTLPLIAAISSKFRSGGLIALLGGVTPKSLPEYQPAQLRIESGTVIFYHLRGPGVVGKAEYILDDPFAPSPQHKTVRFKKSFKNSPTVIIGMSTLDINNKYRGGGKGEPVNTRVRVYLEAADDPSANIDYEKKDIEKQAIAAIFPESFTLKAETWGSSYIHEVTVNWVAYGY